MRREAVKEVITIPPLSGSNVGTAPVVIQPKLQVPARHAGQLSRPRLLELLGTFPDRKVTLVSAPPGYGKTTLLAQWGQVENTNLSFAWVSLDEQDNDPVRLWNHIVEALRSGASESDFGTDVLVALNAVGQSVGGEGLIKIVLPMLINRLAGLPHRLIVVLDDFQCLEEEGISQGSVAFFVEHLPENVHLVLSCRSDPPMSLARLRATEELNEVRIEQLAFSEEEAAQLLNEKMGLDLSPDDISLLLDRTEGWPAAIYLAALSLQGKEDKHAFIVSFGGSNRYVVDLLGEEVLASISADVKEFLLRTSILRKMTASLCDAVAGRKDSAKLLRELARSNLFVVSLDERGEWYRYHNLFSDLLLYELKISQPELLPVLYHRASTWLEGAAFLDAAIRLAVAATDYERAVMLITRHWFGYAVVGQTATVERWLEALPEGLAQRETPLVIVRAWICGLSGRSKEVENLLTLAGTLPYEGPLPDGTASVESSVATIRAIFGMSGIQNMLEATRGAAVLAPDETSPPAAGLVYMTQGFSWYCSGDTTQARSILEAGLRVTESNQAISRISLLCVLSFVAGDEGYLEEAESRAREACTLVDRFGLQSTLGATCAPIALGRVLAKRGRLAESQRTLEGALSHRRMFARVSPWLTLIGLLALAPVCLERGDRNKARAVLDEAQAILEASPDAGIFPELLERHKRKLHTQKPRNGQLDGELTQRELEVLRLLPGQLSAPQIAQSFYVAPTTVRSQIKSIYRKLGVSSRKEAVEEARTKGLI